MIQKRSVTISMSSRLGTVVYRDIEQPSNAQPLTACQHNITAINSQHNSQYTTANFWRCYTRMPTFDISAIIQPTIIIMLWEAIYNFHKFQKYTDYNHLLFSIIGPIPWGHSGPLCHSLP